MSPSSLSMSVAIPCLCSNSVFFFPLIGKCRNCQSKTLTSTVDVPLNGFFIYSRILSFGSEGYNETQLPLTLCSRKIFLIFWLFIIIVALMCGHVRFLWNLLNKLFSCGVTGYSLQLLLPILFCSPIASFFFCVYTLGILLMCLFICDRCGSSTRFTRPQGEFVVGLRVASDNSDMQPS